MGNLSETSSTGATRQREQPKPEPVIHCHLEIYHNELDEVEKWLKKSLEGLSKFTGIKSKITTMTLDRKR